jgi:tetratricopeptide (TPR) repeat protein
VRVVAIESPNPGKKGDHVYRTRQPCRALGELSGTAVQSGSLLAPAVHDELLRADVLVLADVVDPDLLPIVEARRAAGLLTVYEINDHFLAPAAESPSAYLAKNPLLRSLSSQLGTRTDAVQFSMPELAREFGHLNENRAVFVNHLWEIPALPRRPTRNEIWLGWGGSAGHLDDIAWVAPALKAALARHPQLKLAFMGTEKLLPLFAEVPAARLRHVPSGPLERYYEFVAGLDIGICPLLASDFNRCRSDVKFLELAARGVPAICSDLAPYRDAVRAGENGFFFRGLDELGAHIDRLVTDPELRASIGDAAHAYVRSQRRERDHALARLAQYRAWQSRPDRDAEPPLYIPRVYPESNYRLLGGDAVERALYEGLTAAVAGRLTEALENLAEAQRRCPDFYLPHLYLGTLEPDPSRAISALERARALAPTSVNAALQLGMRLKSQGRTTEAAAAFEACCRLAPALGAGDAHLGALAEAAGRPAEAAAFYERAYAANRFFAPPVLCLAEAALAARDTGRATALLEAALKDDPRMWRFHFLLGRAYADAGRWQAAAHHLDRALADADERAPVLALLAKSQIALGNVSGAKAIVAELRQSTPVSTAIDAAART